VRAAGSSRQAPSPGRDKPGLRERVITGAFLPYDTSCATDHDKQFEMFGICFENPRVKRTSTLRTRNTGTPRSG